MAPGKHTRTKISNKDDSGDGCLVPGCSAIAQRSNIALFSMSFGDLPFWWNSTAWVAKYKSELPTDARICESHFEERFIDRTRKKPRLYPGTVPTLQLGVLELRQSADEKPDFNPIVFYCRLCAKKDARPIKTQLDQLPSMAEIIACCLGNYQKQAELPTGVCEDCIQVMRQFDVFVKKCEQSQVQLIKISGDHGADKENSTNNPIEFESVDLCMESEVQPEDFESNPERGIIKRQCSHCGKGFANIDNYREHLKLHNTKKPVYVCQICSRSFDDKHRLREHLESVHENKKNECSVCSKRFGVRSALNSHMRIHSYKHKCNECDRAFQSLDKLEVHKTRHSGEKYKCDMCAVEFKLKSRLKTHKMRVHHETFVESNKGEEGSMEKDIVANLEAVEQANVST